MENTNTPDNNDVISPASAKRLVFFGTGAILLGIGTVCAALSGRLPRTQGEPSKDALAVASFYTLGAGVLLVDRALRPRRATTGATAVPATTVAVAAPTATAAPAPPAGETAR